MIVSPVRTANAVPTALSRISFVSGLGSFDPGPEFVRRRRVYLLFVDESGTHGGSHSFILGGIAVHEDDAQRLQTEIDAVIAQELGRIPPNLDEYELHASEMRNAKKPPQPGRTSRGASGRP
jgi:hypothetical protein